jgi:signal peptidase II
MVDGERGRSGRPDRRSAVLAEFPAPDAAGPASGPDAAGPDGSGPDGGTATAPARRPRTRLLLLLAAAVLAVDAGSKIAVVATMDQGQSIRLLGGVVYLSFYRNTGAAFSFAQGATILFTVIAVAVAVVIVRTARRLYSAGWATALGLVLGGAVGNLVDRVFRSPGFLRGGVVDFLSLFGPDGRVWPVFNVADSAIVCGGILGALLAVRGIEFDGSRGRDG